MKDIMNLVGRISKENVETLQEFAAKAAEGKKEAVIVDIGTLAGMSAIAMALAAPNIKVLTCDPNFVQVLNDQLEEMGVIDRVKYYQMTSEEFAPYCPEEIDMCFIDGVHNYAGVKHDIENIGKHVRKGGYILFHDRNLYFNTIGAAIAEFEGVLYEKVKEQEATGEREGSIYVARRI